MNSDSIRPMSALPKKIRLVGPYVLSTLARQGAALRQSLVVAAMAASTGYAFAGPNTNFPFIDTFETYTNGTPLIDGTNGWYGDSSAIIVQTNTVRTGTNAAMVPEDCTLSNLFVSTSPTNNVWIQMDMRPQPYTDTNIPVVNTNGAAIFYINSNGNFVVHDGTTDTPSNSLNWVVLTNSVINTNGTTWVTIGIFEDYNRKKWELYTNGTLVTNNIRFVNPTLTNFTGFGVYNGSETSYLDNVSVIISNRTAAYIGLSATTLTYTAIYTGASPANQTVIMTNLGQTEFAYSNTVSYGAGASNWLTVTPVMGALLGNATQVLTSAVNSSSLTVGVYVATNTISSDATNAPQTIVVTLTVRKTATITLNDLTQTYNGNARVVTATTVPTGLTVNITYDGNSWAPTNSGTYAVTGVVADAIYYGSTNGTLTVVKADQTITNFPNPGGQILTNAVRLWAQASSGLAVTNFTVISGPGVISGLTNLTFTNSGIVSVTANQPGDNNWNAAPAVTNTFNVNKPTAPVTLNNLNQTYNGSARVVTATTVPAGLTVNITYDGNSWAPTNPGTYTVGGVVVDATYQGATTGTLTVSYTAPTASKGAYSDKVMVYWDSIPSATSYQVWRGTNSNVQNASLLGTSSTLFYLDTSTTPDVVYYYRVQSVTATGVSGLSLPDSGYCGTIANLTSPAGLQASDGGYTDRIRTTWAAVGNATHYEVWRSTENNRSTASLISEPTGTSCDDYSVTPGIYYYYWLKARTAHRDGDFSESDAGYCGLSAPTGVSASNDSYPYHIRVVWNSVANAAWYEVWREEIPGSNSEGGNLAKVAQTSELYFNDYYTKSGVYYRYKVKACNELGSSIDYGQNTGHRQVNASPTSLFAMNDYDGDKLSDLALFNPLSGVLDVLRSALGRQIFVLGAGNSQGVTGDYDGDRLADPVAYYSNSGTWLAMFSSMGYNPIIRVSFGGNGYNSVAADFDGDGITDMGVYNETGGVLSAILSNGGAFDIRLSCSMGGACYSFVSADFDGDGKADPTVYSESKGRVTVLFSGNGYTSASFTLGGPGKDMSAADFDDDGKADPVFYEQTTGLWTVSLSSAGYRTTRISFGGPGYVPATGDYDGDGKADPALYRETDGQWFIMFSASGYSIITETFGGLDYQPVD